MRTLVATSYMAPLREGGSLPALVEAYDPQNAASGLFVLKFRGAGQGPKALIAELIAGALLRAAGLPVPELVFIELDAAFGRAERDPEIQDLLRASEGLNLGMAWLPAALPFDPLLTPPPDPDFASAVVWFDAFLTNVDRTPRNPNMLVVAGQLWLIDHGAALYIHHSWHDYMARSRSRFPQTREHILLPFARRLPAADARLSAILTPDLLHAVVEAVPDTWLIGQDGFATPAEHRAAYRAYLGARLEGRQGFVEEAVNAYAAAHTRTNSDPRNPQ